MFAIAFGAPSVPRIEHGTDCAVQLIARLRRHGPHGPGLGDGCAPFLDGSLGRKSVEAGLEHDACVHLVEAPVRVAGEGVIAAFPRERHFNLLVDAEIEHRLQHARHTDGSAGAYGEQERILGYAEAAPGLPFQNSDAGQKLVEQAAGQRSLCEVGTAGLGRHHERGRDGQARVPHEGDAPRLAADEGTVWKRSAVERENPTADGTHRPIPGGCGRGCAAGPRAARTTPCGRTRSARR